MELLFTHQNQHDNMTQVQTLKRCNANHVAHRSWSNQGSGALSKRPTGPADALLWDADAQHAKAIPEKATTMLKTVA